MLLQVVLYLFLSNIILAAYAQSYDPFKWKPYLMQNRQKQCDSNQNQARLPKSYFATNSYFAGIPKNERNSPEQMYKQPVAVPACGNKVVDPVAMAAYSFQSETLLTISGLNIYDGSLHAIALALLGEINLAISYESQIINQSLTCQFKDIRGDALCRGIIVTNQCNDSNQIGYCGFCYGGASETVKKPNAWTFRMISDSWAYAGTVDQRCPEKRGAWTWNDYKPVLGENAWANILGPLQVAMIKYKGIDAIPDDDISIFMSLQVLPTIFKMQSPIGAVFYSPRNTISTQDGVNYVDSGYDISLENNVSLLAALKALRLVLLTKKIQMDKVPLIETLMANITDFVYKSFDHDEGIFRQGGTYNPTTGTWSWTEGPKGFAVDCQTWTMTIIGPKMIDEWFGDGSAVNIWATTKKLGGYRYTVDGQVDGLGFSYNNDDQVFSGEWTLGGINMLKVFAQELNDPSFGAEANKLRDSIQSRLAQNEIIDGVQVVGLRYANKRYWIPFGWFANPILSTASTAWAAMLDSNFNPFYLGGAYRS